MRGDIRDQKKMENIEKLSSSNPKHFWDQLKKLRPNKHQEIPMTVHNDRGEFISDPEIVSERWKSEFRKLHYPPTSDHDHEFVRTIKQRVTQCEHNFLDPLYIPPANTFPNERITLDEVDKAVRKAKSGKATCR